jgi:hypothetical protein
MTSPSPIGKSDLGFPLEGARKVGKGCSVDAFNKDTTPLGVVVGNSGIARVRLSPAASPAKTR